MTSILSGSGGVKLTEDVRLAVGAVSRLPHTPSSSSSVAAPSTVYVPFCVLKFVEGSESTVTVETLSALDINSGLGSISQSVVPSTWDQLVASLPREQCRMALAQVPWTAHSDQVTRSRLIFVLWAPSHGPTVKQRMTASMFSLGRKMTIKEWVGMPVRVEAAGVDDLELVDVQDKIRSKATVK